ncbi:1,6-dihydroxycyclohexa-2,4-diene-1-carboxylate dehydrogenase [Neisseria leonii]|uniref:1,6-dihydroxycyclohexa-2,4-diene-1-carboxylate dehydrogenase n=1 Tax=Neisseria leonii TaxID=2995413 RepID=UPI00237AC939|nr:1,6-dihydroxycyclohexa-2,4-diene-1-carboxylate dehydrogenase [Neisseria sp. 3986]MDD9325047.1 1,6-dihydroxycyclohexa-2,4-diene-1-carboxylate dehydrogenase [Neisseria sp. 3986]
MHGAKRFKNKTVVVTGAAQGIGRSIAIEAAAEGANVVLADRSETVNDTAAAIKKKRGKASVVLADLETWESAQSVMRSAVETYGRIDVLVNNVGGTIWAKPFEHYAPEEIEAEIRRSLFPTLWCCRAVLPQMQAQKSGAIVNISSIATRGIYRIPYSAAKGGINALTASLAFEQAANGIRINAVATGGTEAPPRIVPRNPKPLSAQEKAWYQSIVDQTVSSSLMKRYGTIEEQTAAILFLASDEASYITGSVLPVGGGDQG